MVKKGEGKLISVIIPFYNNTKYTADNFFQFIDIINNIENIYGDFKMKGTNISYYELEEYIDKHKVRDKCLQCDIFYHIITLSFFCKYMFYML